MTTHACSRCGHESHCTHGTWSDRHAVMATVAGIFTLVFMSMMLTVYPLAGWSVVALCVAGYAQRRVDQERERRRALADRADWEHRQLMSLPPIRTPGATVTQLRPRDASHFDSTSPMRKVAR